MVWGQLQFQESYVSSRMSAWFKGPSSGSEEKLQEEEPGPDPG